MTPKELIDQMPAAFDSEAAGDVNATIQFDLSEPYYIVINDGELTTHEGDADSSDVTLIMEDDDFVSLMKGELDGMTAFMTGKLKLEGDMMLAQRLGSFFDRSKLEG